MKRRRRFYPPALFSAPVMVVLLAVWCGCSRSEEPAPSRGGVTLNRSPPSDPLPRADDAPGSPGHARSSQARDSRPPGKRELSRPAAQREASVGQAGEDAPEPPWLSQLGAAHEAADLAETPATRREAVETVGRAFREPSPAGVSQAEALDIRQDLAARAAQLELSLGDAESALDWTRRGLALSQSASVFRANLLMIQADVLTTQERPDLARKALLEALEVNTALLEQELENP